MCFCRLLLVEKGGLGQRRRRCVLQNVQSVGNDRRKTWWMTFCHRHLPQISIFPHFPRFRDAPSDNRNLKKKGCVGAGLGQSEPMIEMLATPNSGPATDSHHRRAVQHRRLTIATYYLLRRLSGGWS